MTVMKGEAAAFRAYYSEVDEKMRKQIYADIMSCQIAGDPDAFEKLTVKIVAYTAAGRLLPSQSKACHDLLALISHSIVARRTSTEKVTVTAEVTKTIAAAGRLEKEVKRRLPDYGTLDEFTKKHKKDKSPDVIEAVEVPKTTPKLRLKQPK